MKNKTALFCLFLLIVFTFRALAQSKDSAADLARRVDSIEASFQYQTGKISLGKDLAELTVPPGYKFLDAKQSIYVLHDLWNNPPDSDILGMLMPEKGHLFGNDVMAVLISYSDEGHIKDDDAKDLNYDDLLKEMQKDARESNPQRKKEGYPEIELIGWAAMPFYDAGTHKLHWAKEFSFDHDSSHTLNYDIRILGRNGFLELSAIGQMNIMPLFRRDIDKILASVNFSPSNSYKRFDPSIDKVAAYGIGGLILGKVLAKAGLLALLIKFWKIILLAIGGGLASMKRFFTGRKKTTNEEAVAALYPSISEDPEEENKENEPQE